MNIVTINGINSIEFCENILDLLDSCQLFCIDKGGFVQDRQGLNSIRYIEPDDVGGWGKLVHVPKESDEVAQIVFSSGTEGEPKAICLTHRNLADTVNRLIDVMQMDESIREYIGIPVTYSFGLGRVRAVSAVGGKFYLPRQFDIAEISGLLKEEKINAISTVPSLWRLLLASPDELGSEREKVRWIEIGSQYMAAIEKQQMRRIFPNARIVQHYGLTEASRTTFLVVSDSTEGDLESVGTPFGNVEVQIGDRNNICIRGPHVTKGILKDNGELVSLTDENGWLQTNDKGRLENGKLFYEGRLDDQINIGGIKLAAEAVEREISVLTAIPRPAYAICRLSDPLRGDRALLVADETVVKEEFDELQRVAQSVLNKKGISGSQSLVAKRVETIPRTETGKVQRQKMADQFAEQSEIAQQNARYGLRDLFKRKRINSIKGVFGANFPNQAIQSDSSFESLGGDSLSYISVSLDLEKLIPNLPTNWSSMSIEELKSLSCKKSFWTKLDTPTVIRALAIMLVASRHLEFVEYGDGATHALLMIAGYTFAMFSMPTVINDKSIAPIGYLIFRVYFLTASVLLLTFLLTGYGHLIAFSMISNYFSPVIGGETWFVQVYIQFLVLLALIFLSGRARIFAEKAGFSLWVLVLFVSIAFYLIIEHMYNFDYLDGQIPHLLAWIFLFGFTLRYASSVMQKVFLTLLFILVEAHFYSFAIEAWEILVLLLIWFPAIPLPRISIPIIKSIAGASLIIYLTHERFEGLVMNTRFGEPSVNWLVAIIGGVVLWKLYNPLDVYFHAMFNRFLARRALNNNPT